MQKVAAISNNIRNAGTEIEIPIAEGLNLHPGYQSKKTCKSYLLLCLMNKTCSSNCGKLKQGNNLVKSLLYNVLHKEHIGDKEFTLFRFFK